ncbi:MAG: hypothetical protein AVDCRST_MAG30-755, partial [uncultured Solirubrobacteraceae bacterium]
APRRHLRPLRSVAPRRRDAVPARRRAPLGARRGRRPARRRGRGRPAAAAPARLAAALVDLAPRDRRAREDAPRDLPRPARPRLVGGPARLLREGDARRRHPRAARRARRRAHARGRPRLGRLDELPARHRGARAHLARPRPGDPAPVVPHEALPARAAVRLLPAARLDARARPGRAAQRARGLRAPDPGGDDPPGRVHRPRSQALLAHPPGPRSRRGDHGALPDVPHPRDAPARLARPADGAGPGGHRRGRPDPLGGRLRAARRRRRGDPAGRRALPPGGGAGRGARADPLVRARL